MGMQDYGPAGNFTDNPSHTAHHKSIADAIVSDGALSGRFAALGHEHATDRGFSYDYFGSDAGTDPGPGNIAVQGSGNQPRVMAISNVDADGVTRAFQILLPGDTLVITDDPASPPVTGFARYVITDDPELMGTYVVVNAVRTDTVGAINPPAIGTPVRVLATLTSVGQPTAPRVTHPNETDTLIEAYDASIGDWVAVSYDSGMRDVTGLILDPSYLGTSDNVCTMRRFLNTVQYRFGLNATAMGTGVTEFIGPIDPDFRPDSAYLPNNFYQQAVAEQLTGMYFSGDNIALNWSGHSPGENVRYSIVLPCNRSIPSILPGVLG